MSRYEYLKTLESHLRLSLSRSEINDILRDYGEYFTEGENQGKSEWEIIAKLGDPKEVAQQIISESTKGQRKNSASLVMDRITDSAKSVVNAVSNFLKTSGGKITLALLVLLCAPLWVSACGAFLGALLAFFGGLAGLALLCIAIILFGIAAAVTTTLFMTVLPFTVNLLLLTVSIGLVAGGVLGCSLLMLAFNWGCKFVMHFSGWIKNYFTSRSSTPSTNTILDPNNQEGETEHA